MSVRTRRETVAHRPKIRPAASMISKRADRANTAPVRANDTGGKRNAGWAGWPGLILAALCLAAMATASEPRPPTFDKIATATVNYFAAIPNFRRGDLISQQQVTAVLQAIEGVGWKVPGGEQL